MKFQKELLNVLQQMKPVKPNEKETRLILKLIPKGCIRHFCHDNNFQLSVLVTYESNC